MSLIYKFWRHSFNKSRATASIYSLAVFFISLAWLSNDAAPNCSAKVALTPNKRLSAKSHLLASRPITEGDKKLASIYSFKAKTLDGKEVDFSSYEGDVLLIVNTASQCGFTPQFEGLESLQNKYADRGFKVLGFPCNQFGNQEPGDSNAIASFCKKNYGVTFQMFDKIDVNGKDAHPLYKYLTSSAPGVLGSEAIKWNFTKFLIDRQGNIVKRFAPNVAPEKITSEIEPLLKQTSQ